MPVERYRDLREMPSPPRAAGSVLLRRIAAVWERAHLRAGPDIPVGLARYRDLEQAQAARRARTAARARRLRSG
jgi:hypothetical protein